MSQEFISKISQSGLQAAQRLHIRNALNPILWLCGISTTTCFGFAYLFKEYDFIRNLLVIIGIIPIVLACIVIGGFAIFKPEKLQSEEYQLRHQSLKMIEEKSGRITVDATSIEALASWERDVMKQIPDANRTP